MFLTSEHCFKCGVETKHHNGRCSECAARDRTEADLIWASLSVEDKIETLRRELEQLRSRDIMDG